MTHDEIVVDEFTFLVGTERGDVENKKNIGSMLSVIKNNKKHMSDANLNITFDSIQLIHDVYGKGTTRKRCNHRGFCTYRGHRNTNRSHPGPFVDGDNIMNHQYFQQTQQTDNLSQLFAEKKVNDLGDLATNFLETEYPSIKKVINNCCDKSILTSGCPLEYSKRDMQSNRISIKKNKQTNWLGFCCSNHIDSCDSIQHNKAMSQLYKERCHSLYMKTLETNIGPGMPTTCQYLHVWDNKALSKEYIVHSYFIYNGLGIAQSLFDGCGFTFLGYAFSHCTSLCYLEHISNNSIILRNNPNIFSLLAWGKSGGLKDALRSM